MKNEGSPDPFHFCVVSERICANESIIVQVKCKSRQSRNYKTNNLKTGENRKRKL